MDINMDMLTGDPDPREVIVTYVSERALPDATAVRLRLTDGTAAEGGEVELHISGTVMTAYGFDAALARFDRYVNTAFPSDVRLAAALGLAEHGHYAVQSSEVGPYIVAPVLPSAVAA